MTKDVLYNYDSFTEDRITDIFTGWDGLGGYHGLLIRKCAGLFVGQTVLDVGCGLCHLHEGLKKLTHRGVKRYVGIEKNPYILSLAQQRYPDLQLIEGDMYSLPKDERFDSVYAVGVYREEPRSNKGIIELLNITNRCLILTYFAEEKARVPEVLMCDTASCEFIDHTIDDRLEIVRMWKH